MGQKCSLLLGSATILLMLSTAGAHAAVDHKSPKECNKELYSRLGAIQAAGVTPSQFIHECWWHSQRGQPTPLASNSAAGNPTAKAAADRPSSAVEASRSDQGSRAGATERPKRRAWGAVRLERLARSARRRGPTIAMRHADRRRVARTETMRRRFARNRLAKREMLRRFYQRDELAANEGLRRSALRETLAGSVGLRRRAIRDTLATASRTRNVREEPRLTGPDEPGDLRLALASQGPTAREGERMWVQVVAGGQVQLKHAVFVGGLPEGAERTNALNCWGQPVLFVGRDATHWSRSMVCDGKPAGANEWSARIYYGGADTDKAR